MKIIEKEIKGVYEIQLEEKDEHENSMKTYDEKIFKKHGLNRKWLHDNHSFSKSKFTMRGFHFQHPPFTETKIARVAIGEIFFVYLDIRRNSPTFGEWGTIILSEKNKKMLYIKRGIALGMCTMTNGCHLLYKFDNYFSSQHYDRINLFDSDLGIDWPTKNGIISEQDLNAQSFQDFVKKYEGLELP